MPPGVCTTTTADGVSAPSGCRCSGPRRSFTLTGTGDVLEPEDGVIAIGSGGNYALAAARALMEVGGLSAEEIARRAMKIAAEICVYTNNNVILETI